MIEVENAGKEKTSRLNGVNNKKNLIDVVWRHSGSYNPFFIE